MAPGDFHETGNSTSSPNNKNILIPISTNQHPSLLPSLNYSLPPQDVNRPTSNVKFDDSVKINDNKENRNTSKAGFMNSENNLARNDTVSSIGDGITPTQKLESILQRLEMVLVNLLESIRR